MPVEPQLWQLLQRAQQLWLRTGGAFDITSGPLSKAWGFFRRSGRFPSPEEVAAALRRVGGDAIELDADAGTIRFSREGLEINLNAIGKGYALDRAAELLTRLGVQDFLIHGGQSSVLARGRRATGDAALSGWLINVAHPLRPDRRLAELRLIDQAVGTSGAGNQYFYFQGRRYGHVIDPRTGYPADQVLSVTVIARDAATADALATACYVLGVEASLALLATEPDCGAVFVVSGERAGSVRLITHGVNDQQLRVLGEGSA